MTSDHIRKIIAQQDAATAFLREHQKGQGGVGFSEPDPEPLITEIVEISGSLKAVVNEGGTKFVRRKARIVRLQNGELEVIDGGLGKDISVKDSKKILPVKLTRKLNSLL